MRSKSGFSIVEIIVVIIILGVLATLAVTAYNKHIIKSRFSTMLSSAVAAQFAVTNDYFSQGKNFANVDYSAGSADFVSTSLDFITSIAITNGTIVITGDASKLSNNAIVINLVPTASNNEITWTCYTASSFFEFAPDDCHNAL